MGEPNEEDRNRLNSQVEPAGAGPEAKETVAEPKAKPQKKPRK